MASPPSRPPPRRRTWRRRSRRSACPQRSVGGGRSTPSPRSGSPTPPGTGPGGPRGGRRRGAPVPGELSGGQQQRVAIARALVKEPDVLLADEPTGNLDEETRDEIMDLMEGLWGDRGLTLVIVTHDSAVAKRAERRLHIKHGTVTERG